MVLGLKGSRFSLQHKQQQKIALANSFGFMFDVHVYATRNTVIVRGVQLLKSAFFI